DDLVRDRGKNAELLFEGAAARTRIGGGESRIRAQVSTGVKSWFGCRGEEIHVVADFPDVAGDASSETILPASARTSGIVTTHDGSEWKLMSLVCGVVMESPDHDVCVQTGKADEERSSALILKARDIDSNFVE